MKLEDMTPHSLAALNELEYEAAEAVIGRAAEAGDQRAAWLDACIDAVVNTCGTYEPEFVHLMDDCPYTHAHTRHWCGHLFCRDS